MRPDDALLLDIAQAARLIMRFQEGLDFPGFVEDVKTRSAVVHQLLIIGEAAKRLSEPFKAAHPSIPWSAIARMRDKMVHHYEAIDDGEVWKAASRDVPALLAYLTPLLRSRRADVMMVWIRATPAAN